MLFKCTTKACLSLINVIRKHLKGLEWDLVFTKKGKYFFFNSTEKRACWEPPSDLLDKLTKLPEHILFSLFDPFNDDEDHDYGPENSVEEVEYEIVEDNEDEIEQQQEQVTKPIILGDHKTRVNNFLCLLRNPPVPLDPFKPWESHLAPLLESHPDFQAIPSAKERAQLFASISSELAQKAREERQARLVQAKKTWIDLVNSIVDLKGVPQTWTEYCKSIRSKDWYKLLDAKLMEKEWRSRINELKSRQISYNVISNT